jgi:isoleucyl-tRNA synthetase
VNAFMTVDLSAFYLDVSKDRLYTFGARSRERRSAQTALYLMADGLARLMAPILVVTADEIWRHLPGSRDASVHLAEFPADAAALIDESIEADWAPLMEVRAAVNGALESLRQDKKIGQSLMAHVTVSGGPHQALLARHRDALPMFFGTSGVTLEPGGEALSIVVRVADGERCDRCWRYVADRVADGANEGICRRCAAALESPRG